ncbi:ATP-binding protein [Nocardioides aurantiacus]|uniref:ATP-binding protein n=1 Tax=Nocardioides aurantiacus TaxID=86796 RepID=UPI00403FAB83
MLDPGTDVGVPAEGRGSASVPRWPTGDHRPAARGERRTPEGVALEVADTGSGIPEDEVARVFGRFFPGSRAVEQHVSGTGLGRRPHHRRVDRRRPRRHRHSREPARPGQHLPGAAAAPDPAAPRPTPPRPDPDYADARTEVRRPGGRTGTDPPLGETCVRASATAGPQTPAARDHGGHGLPVGREVSSSADAPASWSR